MQFSIIKRIKSQCGNQTSQSSCFSASTSNSICCFGNITISGAPATIYPNQCVPFAANAMTGYSTGTNLNCAMQNIISTCQAFNTQSSCISNTSPQCCWLTSSNASPMCIPSQSTYSSCGSSNSSGVINNITCSSSCITNTGPPPTCNGQTPCSCKAQSSNLGSCCWKVVTNGILNGCGYLGLYQSFSSINASNSGTNLTISFDCTGQSLCSQNNNGSTNNNNNNQYGYGASSFIIISFEILFALIFLLF